VYDYTVEVDTTKAITNDVDVWDAIPVEYTVEGPNSLPAAARETATASMDTIFEVLQTDHHFEWLNLVVNNDLRGYKLRLSYKVDILCECGRWTPPRWKCSVCYTHACWAHCHNCKELLDG
jgi:hypothetical protein